MEMESLPASSSSSSAEFDVFLSFRGADTRNNFTGHLQEKLLGKGIDSFIDDRLRRGDDITALFDRIEQSKIAIIVFSENYANSVWCLRELVKILQCRDRNQQLVIPILYKIDKSKLKNVRKTRFTGVTEDEIVSWEAAISTAVDISGYVVDRYSTSEAKLVNDIAFDTFKKLNDLAPIGNTGLVGIESRLKTLEKLLSCHELDYVHVIGIIGMGGIGKTTLADCLYERMRGMFDGCCFLANIRENSGRSGIESLQKELFSTLLDDRYLKTGAPASAHQRFHRRLKSKRLLIVLDDVNDEKQIKYLMGHCKWYQGGSRIIITTRDSKLIKGQKYVLPKLNDREALKLFCLNAFAGSCPLKEFEGLTNMFLDYARGHPLALKVLGSDLRDMNKLFWEAKLDLLKSKSHGDIYEVLETSYEELSDDQKDIFLDIACFFRSEKVDYVTSLLNSRGVDVSSVIQDLVDKCLITRSDNRIEMHDMLQTMGKEISFKPEPIGIRDIRWLSQHRPQHHWHLRLWDSEDICDMLTKGLGTEKIRGIFLDTSKRGKLRLRPDAFKGMYNLKYLKIYDSRCSRGCEAVFKLHFKGLDFLPDELAYLHWHGFPLQRFPLDFDPKNLVDLKLPHSELEEIWGDDKVAGMLKWVDLSHSSNLCRLLGLAKAHNLERLNLEGCTSLKMLPSSINCLEKLVYLNLRECTSLKSLPEETKSQSLQTLILSGCSSLKKFPLISESIEVLLLDGTAIKSLPDSIETSSKLASLNLKNCKRLKHLSSNLYKLKCLQELILSGCSQLEVFPEIKEDMESLEILLLDDTSITEMPNMKHLSNIKTFSLCGTNCEVSVRVLFLSPPLGCSRLTDLYLSRCSLYRIPNISGNGLSSLQSLCLSGNSIENLPESFNQLHNLKWFDLKYCKNLKSLPVLPQNLQYLDAHECESLETLANPLTPLTVGERIHSMFMFSNCYKLNQDAQESLVGHARIKSQLMANASVKRYYRGFIPEPLVGVCFPATEIPSWFFYQRLGRSLDISLPPHWCDTNFVGLAFSVVVSFKEYEDCAKRFSVKCSGKFEDQDGSFTRFNFTLAGWNEPCGTLRHEPRKLTSDHVFMGYNSCFQVKKLHGESNSCCYTKASFKFYATDDEKKKKLEMCEVIKCGMSLVYVPEDDEECMLLKKTNLVQLSWKTEPSCSNGSDDVNIMDDLRPKRGRCQVGGGDEEPYHKRTK
ncbi:unnamed protein product [Brassica rapa]|uniref:ADP-ribosyl cyclase/cyclic ADP-ribose hydrolase n=1 Tax=Brassica campestris TaxID=3711 RepID=A0A3P5ZSK7_BRACM|nr:unnamed protein product [Brassica rapa]VDC80929.1 unnamed protein product [Brassica rapa]